MRIVSHADDSHKISGLVFQKKKNEKIVKNNIENVAYFCCDCFVKHVNDLSYTRMEVYNFYEFVC